MGKDSFIHILVTHSVGDFYFESLLTKFGLFVGVVFLGIHMIRTGGVLNSLHRIPVGLLIGLQHAIYWHFLRRTYYRATENDEEIIWALAMALMTMWPIMFVVGVIHMLHIKMHVSHVRQRFASILYILGCCPWLVTFCIDMGFKDAYVLLDINVLGWLLYIGWVIFCGANLFNIWRPRTI